MKVCKSKLIALADSDMIASLHHALDGLEKVIKENAREITKIKKFLKDKRK
jgi:hypothetical protein